MTHGLPKTLMYGGSKLTAVLPLTKLVSVPVILKTTTRGKNLKLLIVGGSIASVYSGSMEVVVVLDVVIVDVEAELVVVESTVDEVVDVGTVVESAVVEVLEDVLDGKVVGDEVVLEVLDVGELVDDEVVLEVVG
jgi:hypothetical protein